MEDFSKNLIDNPMGQDSTLSRSGTPSSGIYSNLSSSPESNKSINVDKVSSSNAKKELVIL